MSFEFVLSLALCIVACSGVSGGVCILNVHFLFPVIFGNVVYANIKINLSLQKKH